MLELAAVLDLLVDAEVCPVILDALIDQREIWAHIGGPGLSLLLAAQIFHGSYRLSGGKDFEARALRLLISILLQHFLGRFSWRQQFNVDMCVY